MAEHGKMKDKEFIRQVLMVEMQRLSHELMKCKLIHDHIDDYDFYVMPEAEPQDFISNTRH